MKVIVTGDREWTDVELIESTIRSVRAQEVVEGECRGADVLARAVALKIGLRVYAYPADWRAFGQRAGPARNAEMLRDHKDADLVLAFHDDLSGSRGTLDMVIRCVMAGKSVMMTRHGRNGRAEVQMIRSQEELSAYLTVTAKL